MTTSPSVVACARGDAHRPWPSAGGGAIAHASEEPATPRERAPPAIAVFEHVLQMCARAGGRILTIHGRRAEKDVVVLLERNRRAGTPVLHWFSGSLRSCCTHRPSPEYSKECSRPATSPCQPVADIVQSGMRAASYCEDTTYKVETAHRHVSRLFCGPYGAGSPHWTISATGSSVRQPDSEGSRAGLHAVNARAIACNWRSATSDPASRHRRDPRGGRVASSARRIESDPVEDARAAG